MTAGLRHEDVHLQRMQQASLWLQRMLSAGQDERVVDDWLEWCQRDPLNQQAFDEVAAIWDLSGKVSRQPAVDLAASRINRPRRAMVASLAGVTLATLAGAWWWVRPLPVEALTSEIVSPVGTNTLETLADGSVLELGGARASRCPSAPDSAGWSCTMASCSSRYDMTPRVRSRSVPADSM